MPRKKTKKADVQELKSFSCRWPSSLVDQVDKQAADLGMSRNAYVRLAAASAVASAGTGEALGLFETSISSAMEKAIVNALRQAPIPPRESRG